MTAVRLDRVSKIYKGGVLAVNDVSLSAEQGELLVLVGPSGSGKTTILRIIAGLEELTSGEGRLGRDGAHAPPAPARHARDGLPGSALQPPRAPRATHAFPLPT